MDWGHDLESPEPRPLPPAFVSTFGSPLNTPKLLGFMLWEGVAANKKFQHDFYRKSEEWKAFWAEQQQRMKRLSEKARPR